MLLNNFVEGVFRGRQVVDGTKKIGTLPLYLQHCEVKAEQQMRIFMDCDSEARSLHYFSTCT